MEYKTLLLWSAVLSSLYKSNEIIYLLFDHPDKIQIIYLCTSKLFKCGNLVIFSISIIANRSNFMHHL